jgi:hypothetical protein
MTLYKCPRCKASIDYSLILRAFTNTVVEPFICVTFDMKCPLCENFITVEPILHPDFRLHPYEIEVVDGN